MATGSTVAAGRQFRRLTISLEGKNAFHVRTLVVGPVVVGPVVLSALVVGALVVGTLVLGPLVVGSLVGRFQCNGRQRRAVGSEALFGASEAGRRSRARRPVLKPRPPAALVGPPVLNACLCWRIPV